MLKYKNKKSNFKISIKKVKQKKMKFIYRYFLSKLKDAIKESENHENNIIFYVSSFMIFKHFQREKLKRKDQTRN